MSSPPNGQLFIRRDIWSLETPDVWDPVSQSYALAVRQMQSRPATDPTSWSYQAAMHGTYSTAPPGAPWNGCQHASWYFLSWHRMFIYWFERIVRASIVSQGGSADWALPYWNYSRGVPANSLPPALRAQTMPDGSPNPLYVPDPHRATGVNAGAGLPPSATSYAHAFSFANFTPPPTPGFGGGASTPMQFENATGALENQPHNIVHDLVGGPTSGQCDGGWMSDPMCAAQDPIFWLHHSNIDRLWNHWLAQGQGRSDPNDQAWLNQAFTFYNEHGQSVTMRGADVRDTVRQLSYRYDDEAPFVVVPHPLLAPTLTVPVNPGDPPSIWAQSAAAIELGPEPSTVNLELTETGQTESTALRLATTVTRRVVLRVEGIHIDEHPGVVYAILLNPPAANFDRVADPYFVGHLTFFGAKHHPGHGGHDGHEAGGLNHAYDVTNLVAGQMERNEWQSALQVRFEPLGLQAAAGSAEAPPLPKEIAATIDRVVLIGE